MRTEKDPITVVVVDDHEIVRKGICALLDTVPDIVVVGEAGNGFDGLALADSLSPDVILMDLMMPGMDGVEAIREILSRKPEARVLVLTSFGSDDKLFPALKAGALGYLLKDTSPDALVRAIREARAGQSSLNPVVARRLLRELTRDGESESYSEPLSEREIEVLRLVAHGLTNEAIREQLFISEGTVRTHVSNILAKLNVANRTQAALYALRVGLVSLDEIPESS